MATNGEPEKLYLLQNGMISYCRRTDEDVEYTHTDGFIEKACKWLEKNKDNSLIKSEDSYLSSYLTDEFIDEFKQAMKGGEK